MTPAETLTLAAYFFVLIILAVYGWHRYYLVYLYMRNRDKEPQPGPALLSRSPVVTIQLPLYNEMYVADRLIEAVCAHRLSARAARNPGARRLDRRDARALPSWRSAGSPREGIDIKYLHRADRTRLQGRRARGRAEGRRAASSSPSSTPISFPTRRLPDPADAALRRSEGRHGAGALGPHQPGLLAADEDPVDPARRPLRPRARRPQPRRAVLQLQRHGRHLAPRSRSTTRAAGSTTR